MQVPCGPCPLAVAGAFHTSIMQPAVERLTAALASVPLQKPRLPVISNVDAEPHDDPEEIRRLLIRQVVQPGAMGRFDAPTAGDGLRSILRSRPRPSAPRAAQANRPQGGVLGNGVSRSHLPDGTFRATNDDSDARSRPAGGTYHGTHSVPYWETFIMPKPSDESAPRLTVDLAGHVALVTGASRGIGRATAIALARCGARVACAARNAEKLAETVEAIKSAGGSAEAFECDVTKGEAVQAIVDKIAEGWGRLDIVVNNAGITRDTLLPRMADDQWDDVINTNLRGTFLFTRAATRPMMQARYGRIINISSVSASAAIRARRTTQPRKPP